MHTVEIENKPTITFPEHLGEYTNAQYQHFCQLLAQKNIGIIDYDEFATQLVYKLMDMEHSKRKLTAEELEIRNENIYRLTLLIDGLFTEKTIDNKLYKTLVLSFVDNKIPQFTHNNVVYHGPDDALLNISFDEFLAAINSYNSYNKTQDVADLNQLVAALYRPKKTKTKHNLLTNYDGDVRQEFYQTNVTLRAQELAILAPGIKLGVKLFFEACINYITTATDVNVQGNSIDLTVLFKGKSTQEKSIGMLNVLFSLAETNVFGNKKETGKERYWTILLKLYQNHLDTETQKQQIKDAKRN